MPELDKSSSLVVFVNVQEPNLRLTYASVAVKTLADSIRSSKGWSERGLRLILAGRELYDDDIIEAAQAPVLHCMVSDGPVHGSQRRQHRPPPIVEPVDWMDALDSGRFILWLMAALLVSCWLLFLVKSDLFDQPSIIMLCVMTATFLAPLMRGNVARAAALMRATCTGRPAPEPQQPRRPQTSERSL